MAGSADGRLARPSSHESETVTFERAVSLVLIATPALFAFSSFQAVSDFGVMSRRLSLPVRLAELIIVIVALRDGFTLRGAWGRLAGWTKGLSAIWIGSVVAAAVFANRDPALARVLAAGTILHGIVALALYDRLRDRGPEAALILMRAAAIGLAGYAAAAVFCRVLLAGETGFPWVYFGVGVTNVRQIGFFGLPLVGIALGLLALARTKADKRMDIGLLLAGLFLVIWSGGRASALGAVAALFTAVMLATHRRRLLLTAAAACSAVAAAIAHLLAPSAEYGPVSLLRFVAHEPGSTGIAGYSSSRTQFWEWAWDDIASRPWLGHGEGQFAWMIHDRIGAVYNHPHNVVLQTLYEWGAPGFLAIGLLMAGITVRATRLRGTALAVATPALAGIAALATTSLLDGSLYYPMPLLSAFLLLAVVQTQAAPTRI